MSEGRDRPDPPSVSPFDPARFSMTATCLPCCAQGAATCECALFIPQLDEIEGDIPIYPSEAAAQTAIADFVSGCYVYGGAPPPGFFTIPTLALEDFVASWDPTTNILSFDSGPYSLLPSQPDIGFSSSISVSAGAEVTFTLSRTPARPDGDGMAYILVYTCDSTSDAPTIVFEENIADIGTGGTYVWTVADAGTYFFVVGFFNNGTTPFSTANTVSCDVDMAVNPVIARYDSGDPLNPNRLEACPKLLLPILTESSEAWYASYSEAESAIASQTSNCVGYWTPPFDLTVFTATDGGSSLTLYAETQIPFNVADLYGSVNAEFGETIDINYTLTAGSPPLNVILEIYDENGVLFQDFLDLSGSGSGTFTSDPLPYTGKYLIHCIGGGDPSYDKTFTVVITSSGALTVNPIQALYDIGLEDCPGRLNCSTE